MCLPQDTGERQLVCTTTKPLECDDENDFVPAAQAWTAATQHLVGSEEVAIGLFSSAFEQLDDDGEFFALHTNDQPRRVRLQLEVHMLKDIETFCLYQGRCDGSIADDPETLTFQEVALEGGLGQLKVLFEKTTGRISLHFMTPEREGRHFTIPSIEFTSGAIVMYLNRALRL